jgi:hypothetical protein
MSVQTLRRHPWISAGIGAVVLAALAVPVVAFVIIPAAVSKTVHESLPTAAPTARVGASVAPAPTSPPTPVTLARGELQRIDPVHFGSGTVRIVDLNGARYLSFENVMIAGAPDVYVYLSDASNGTPGNFTNLGKLRATSGDFHYDVPAGVDLARVNSAVLWCRQFTVTITYAVLARS